MYNKNRKIFLERYDVSSEYLQIFLWDVVHSWRWRHCATTCV